MRQSDEPYDDGPEYPAEVWYCVIVHYPGHEDFKLWTRRRDFADRFAAERIAHGADASIATRDIGPPFLSGDDR